MKKSILSLSSIGLLFLMSACNPDTASNNNVGSTDTASTDNSWMMNTQPTDTVQSTTNANTTEPANNGQVVTTVPPQPTASKSTNNAGANPAHGQPGHRCDIPVGAPLNSPASPQQTNAPQPKVTTNASPVKQINPTPPATADQMPKQTTTAGFSGKPNPAHGEVGHRCDIKVGEILP